MVEGRVVERLTEYLIEFGLGGVAVQPHGVDAGLIRLERHASRVVILERRRVRHRLQQRPRPRSEQSGDALVIGDRVGIGEELEGTVELGGFLFLKLDERLGKWLIHIP